LSLGGVLAVSHEEFLRLKTVEGHLLKEELVDCEIGQVELEDVFILDKELRSKDTF